MSKQISDAYIVAATRAPIGKSGRGMFRNTRPDDLLVAVIQAALAQVEAPVLVLLDLMMPVMSGFAFLEEPGDLVRQERRGRHLERLGPDRFLERIRQQDERRRR